MTEAPRWRLTEPHYLKVRELPDGTRIEWEHKETARDTGRMVRKLYPVPILLNPGDPADFNHPNQIIVAHEVDGARSDPNDYIFVDEPTPGMEPLNEAAEAITDRLKIKWAHPVDTLPVNGGMNANEQAFYDNMVAAFSRAAPPPSTQVVPQAQYDELKERLAKLEATIAERSKPAATERRV